jgi:hypothetical protein
MRNFRLSRRAVLRGAGGGLFLRLCPLEVMFEGGRAHGQPSGAARFLLFFQGNGIPAAGYSGQPCRWVPRNRGAGLELNDAMVDLAPLKSHARVMTGISSGGKEIIGEPHADGLSWSLTGLPTPSPGQKLGGPTPDFIAAKTLQGGAPWRQLVLGVLKGGGSPGRRKITADDAGNLIDPETSPQALFNKLFGTFSPPAGGGAPAANPELDRQKLIIDFVKGDAERLKAKLGSADRRRVDAHLAIVRDLEASLFRGGGSGPKAAPSSACARPAAPGTAGEASVDTRAKWMIDLTALAFACDLTRVVSLMASPANDNEDIGFMGLPHKYHDGVSHLSRGQGAATMLSEMTAVTRWHMKHFKSVLEALKSYPDAGGSMLDNTLAVFTSEFGNSNHHARFELPYLLVGGSRFITGDTHWRSPGAAANGLGGVRNTQVWLAVLKALGCPVDSFGGNAAVAPLK